MDYIKGKNFYKFHMHCDLEYKYTQLSVLDTPWRAYWDRTHNFWVYEFPVEVIAKYSGGSHVRLNARTEWN